MWTLTSKKTGSIYYLLPEKEQHTVGRAASDLALAGDTSISRSHACLYVSKDHIKVIDTGSKYGTFCNENIDNNVPIAKNLPINLKNGERIQFGMLGNEWVLSKLNICTFVSRVDGENKAELRKIVQALEGRIVDNWEKCCTHLTMPEITVTHKVLQALVECIPIVSLDFWRTYLRNLRNGQQPPKAVDFVPQSAENFLNANGAFEIAPVRRTLFSGKTFVFFSSDSLEKYSAIVESAGGRCSSLYKGVSKSLLAKKDVIVVRTNTSTQSQSLQATTSDLHKYLRSINRRSIPDSEIGLAIIHCSTEKYCNPDYDMVKKFVVETDEIVPESDVIAKNTPQLETQKFSAKTVIEIPDTEPGDSTEFHTKLPSIVAETDDTVNIQCTEKFDVVVASTPVVEELPCQAKSTSAAGKRKRISREDDRQVKKSHIETTKEAVNRPSGSSSSEEMTQNLILETASTGRTRISRVSDQRPAIATTSNSRANRTIDLSNFIDASQVKQRAMQNSHQSSDSSMAVENRENIETRKRARIPDICSDDDDSELFAFNSVGAKKSKPTTQDDDENDGPPVFNSTSSSLRISQSDNTPNNPRNPSIVNGRVKKPPFKLPAKIKIDIPTDGWLSKSLGRIKLKSSDEADEDKEESSSSSTPTNSTWSKATFEVRVRAMDLVPKISREVSVVAGSSTSSLSRSNVKNFKAFVKKHNYKPQTSVVSTVPVHVGLKMTTSF